MKAHQRPRTQIINKTEPENILCHIQVCKTSHQNTNINNNSKSMYPRTLGSWNQPCIFLMHTHTTPHSFLYLDISSNNSRIILYI